MIHPDRSILLAYIRKQSCDEWEGSIQEHIDDCDSCDAYYAELLRADALINDAVALSIDQTYVSVVDSMMRRVEQPRAAFAGSVYSRGGNALPIPFAAPKFVNIALELVVCCVLVATIVTFVYLRYATGTNVSQQKMPFLTATATDSLNIRRHIGFMATPTSMPTPMPTSVIRVPTIHECQEPGDDGHKRLRICGEHFTPGDSIQLVYTIPSSHGSKIHKDIVVQDDGTFQDSLLFSSCKSFPSAVRAYNQNRRNDNGNGSQVLHPIQLNSCFVEVMKTGGDAKVSAFALLV
jgi:hypothetical protein